MNKRIRTTIAAVLLVPVLASCTQHYYDVKPVAGPDDDRETNVPDVRDHEGRDKQQCFMVYIHAEGWSSTHKDEGIACMVKPDDTTTTTETPK